MLIQPKVSRALRVSL